MPKRFCALNLCFSPIFPGVGGPTEYIYPCGSEGQPRRTCLDGWKLDSQNKCGDISMEPGAWEMYLGNRIDEGPYVAYFFLAAGASLVFI